MSTVESERTSCLPGAVACCFGAAMGLAAWTLTAWARAYCDAGYEAGGRLELNALFPVTALAGGMTALAALAVARRLSRHAPPLVRRCLPPLSVLCATVLLAWWFFATVGTLSDYPGDSGNCPASNIPPQWPGWIPA
ncbi:hypothetical protein [Streptomyces sp. NPDC046909]|uniref:hypothetical protein n=1 Tax=Streptomyces sp. NPDC046909 TaxID=3155617 RepID=UPI0034074DAB